MRRFPIVLDVNTHVKAQFLCVACFLHVYAQTSVTAPPASLATASTDPRSAAWLPPRRCRRFHTRCWKSPPSLNATALRRWDTFYGPIWRRTGSAGWRRWPSEGRSPAQPTVLIRVALGEMAAQGGVSFQEKVSRLLSKEGGKPVLKPNRPLVLKDAVANRKLKKGGETVGSDGRGPSGRTWWVRAWFWLYQTYVLANTWFSCNC